jgi:hypothetical protein
MEHSEIKNSGWKRYYSKRQWSSYFIHQNNKVFLLMKKWLTKKVSFRFLILKIVAGSCCLQQLLSLPLSPHDYGLVASVGKELTELATSAFEGCSCACFKISALAKSYEGFYYTWHPLGRAKPNNVGCRKPKPKQGPGLSPILPLYEAPAWDFMASRARLPMSMYSWERLV